MMFRKVLVAAGAALLAVLVMPAVAANASETAIAHSSASGCYGIKPKHHNRVLVHEVATKNQYGGFAGYGLIGVGYGCSVDNSVPISYISLYHVTLMTSTGEVISEVNGGNTRTHSYVGMFTKHVLCGSTKALFRVRSTVGYAYTDGDYVKAFNVYGPYFHCTKGR